MVLACHKCTLAVLENGCRVVGTWPRHGREARLDKRAPEHVGESGARILALYEFGEPWNYLIWRILESLGLILVPRTGHNVGSPPFGN